MLIELRAHGCHSDLEENVQGIGIVYEQLLPIDYIVEASWEQNLQILVEILEDQREVVEEVHLEVAQRFALSDELDEEGEDIVFKVHVHVLVQVLEQRNEGSLNLYS